MTSSSSSAASRQKSCNACVRGKRRCDKTTPRCTRCAAKGLDCVYQRIPPGCSPSSVTLAHQVGDADMGVHMAGAVAADLSDDFEMGGFSVSDLGSSNNNTNNNTTPSDTLALDPSLEFSIADLLGPGAGGGAGGGAGSTTTSTATTDAGDSSFWNFPGFTTAEPKADYPTLSMPPQPYQQQVIRDVGILNDCRAARTCGSFDPLLIHDPRSSVGYMFDKLLKLHEGFVRTRAMPCAHPRLYSANLPKSLMAAYCGAATYASRSATTRAWAFKAVQDAVAEVHREGALATTPLEKLARVHALIVLDTIRIFDGDLGMRYAAEREISTMKEWVFELVALVEGMALEGTPATWDTWILNESARRTCVIGLAFQCFFSLLKSEPPEPALMGFHIPYTASRHLWEAASSVEFFRAWREQPQWIIRGFDFKDFWMFARAEDMDEFTQMMLTVQSSPDAVDHFLHGDTTIPVSKSSSCH